MKNSIVSFIIVVMKCIIILYFFSVILPIVFDLVVSTLFLKSRKYDNAIYVFRIYKMNYNIFKYYIYIFKCFLTL